MKSLFSSQIGLVGTVMNMQLERQNVIAGNLANIDTPNYKPRELSFEKELQTALGQDMEGQMSRTSAEHIPSAFDASSFRPEWSEAFKPRLEAEAHQAAVGAARTVGPQNTHMLGFEQAQHRCGDFPFPFLQPPHRPFRDSFLPVYVHGTPRGRGRDNASD